MLGTAWAYDKAGNRTNVNDAGQAIRYTANTLNQYTAINGKAPSHNRNGDLLNDGSTRSFTWSGRSEILNVTTQVAVGTTAKESFTYDGLQRRISRTDATGTTFFIHDGWNVIAEYRRVGTTNVLQRRYLWGEDLSGSLQGAGGVGGLIQAVDFTSGNAGSYHYHYDGNANVVEITNVSATVVASYRYDAFGRTLVKAGSYADTNRYRFSTKPLELTSGLYYYGFRCYQPETGRWLSRDPLGEQGGSNLYGMVGNNEVNRIDLLGLDGFSLGGPGQPQVPGGWPIIPMPPSAPTVPETIHLFVRFLLHMGSPGEYSDNIWTAVFAGAEYMDYEKLLLVSAKANAKPDCKTTFKNSLDELDVETIFVDANGNTHLDAGLSVGGYRLKIPEHEVTVDCRNRSCKATTKMKVEISDDYSFPAAGHNMILSPLNIIGAPFHVGDSKDKNWEQTFTSP